MLNEPPFYWATGIENTFIPQTRPGLRALDEYELTQHYTQWRGDLDRVASLGISHLRWGVPWYRVQSAREQWDWAWVDEVLDYMVNVKGIQPILDLMHYGTPFWLEASFVDPDYPQYVAEYAYAFTERYRTLVNFYTPLNEPTVNAHFAGRVAQWPPYCEGEGGYVRVLMQIVRGMALTAQAIRDIQPEARLVQVEALGWSWTNDPALELRVARDRAHEFLAFDLFTGQVEPTDLLWPYLQQNGVSESDLDWLATHAGRADILGVNLYPWSGGEWVTGKDNEPHRRGELTGHHLANVLRMSWQRYQLPLMITETSARRDLEGRALWMDETLASVRFAQTEGIPVIGYTWFPALTMIDWDYRTQTDPLENYLLHLGLWDSTFDANGVLQRTPTPLMKRYRHYIYAFHPTPYLAL